MLWSTIIFATAIDGMQEWTASLFASVTMVPESETMSAPESLETTRGAPDLCDLPPSLAIVAPASLPT
jgi:hypothetical protein